MMSDQSVISSIRPRNNAIWWNLKLTRSPGDTTNSLFLEIKRAQSLMWRVSVFLSSSNILELKLNRSLLQNTSCVIQHSISGLDGRVKKVEDALANLETTIDDLANVKISQAQRISELNATISGKLHGDRVLYYNIKFYKSQNGIIKHCFNL